MRRAGIAIDAAVLAAPVGIDAGVETDIGTVVEGDDRFGFIPVIMGDRRVQFLFEQVRIRNDFDFLETIGGVGVRAASPDHGIRMIHEKRVILFIKRR